MSSQMKGWLIGIAAVLLLVSVYGFMKIDAYNACLKYKEQVQSEFTCRAPAWLPKVDEPVGKEKSAIQLDLPPCPRTRSHP